MRLGIDQMLYHNQRVMAPYLRAIDAAALAAAASGTWWVGSRLDAWSLQETWQAISIFTLTLVVMFVVLGERLQVYHADSAVRPTSGLGGLWEVCLYGIGLGCLAAQTLSDGLPGRVYAAVIIACLTALLLSMIASWAVVRVFRRRGEDSRVWLLVGHNARSARLAKEILAHPEFGIHIDQIVDLPRPGSGESGEASQPPETPSESIELRVLPDVEAIRDILATRVIDEVVVTLPMRTYYDEVHRILTICGEAGISVKLPSEGFNRAGDKADVSYLGRIPLSTHFNGPSSPVLLVLKRAIDLVGSAVGLVLLSPFLALVAASIKLTSPGPILFVQTRVGLHGRRFRMFKFRSMVLGADQLREELAALNQTDGAAFKIRDDPRRTRIGMLLRKYHLDELPQLWNVLVGEMSLVGPRPLPPNEAPGNEWWQRRRLSMPPGLTCIWQVDGDHGMPFREWMESDLDYIDHWSLSLDLRLIASTFGTVLRGTGW